MVYIMKFKVDGACRGNGRRGSIAAAAACLYNRSGSYSSKTNYLPQNNPVPTNQRAEISAIVLALEWALERYSELSNEPYIKVRISSDSQHAIDSMTTWIYKWVNNGWYTAAGLPVANKDLFQLALDLDDKISAIGEVTYTWIPREKNQDADDECNEALDNIQ
ncbi:hypothetical protein TWF281_003232 [Arthrobotrys megalospora]